jgi:hypothetical protein
VELILTRTEHVTESVAHMVDADLARRLVKWQCWSRRRIITTIDAAVTTETAVAVGRRTYRTTPGGADLFGVFGRADCREPSPPRRRPSRTARRERARARNRRLRPVNEAGRRYDFARRRELQRIADRNHMRRLKRLFKGDTPSTSPWCTYVNEPMESEELPDDWLPPPRVCGPDEPPF